MQAWFKLKGGELLDEQISDAYAGMPWSEIAASAYRAYAASTGNKNFRGEPMPDFENLPEPIRIAWQAAVRQTGRCMERGEHALNAEGSWAGWKP